MGSQCGQCWVFVRIIFDKSVGGSSIMCNVETHNAALTKATRAMVTESVFELPCSSQGYVSNSLSSSRTHQREFGGFGLLWQTIVSLGHEAEFLQTFLCIMENK